MPIPKVTVDCVPGVRYITDDHCGGMDWFGMPGYFNETWCFRDDVRGLVRFEPSPVISNQSKLKIVEVVHANT